MKQQSTNSSIINNSSAHRSLPPLVAPDPKQTAPADISLPKAAKGSSKSPAKADTAKAVNSNDRCRHYTATGRRCRLGILDPSSGLCFRHVGRQFQLSDEDLSPAFVGLLSGFQSPSRIHAFLTQVTLLLVQNRVSTRRAAILAYLGQILLRTLPAIDHELHPQEEEQHPVIIMDIDSAVARRALAAQEHQRAQQQQRPLASQRVDPERAMYSRMAERCAPVVASPDPDGYDGYTSIPEKTT